MLLFWSDRGRSTVNPRLSTTTTLMTLVMGSRVVRVHNVHGDNDDDDDDHDDGDNNTTNNNVGYDDAAAAAATCKARMSANVCQVTLLYSSNCSFNS